MRTTELFERPEPWRPYAKDEAWRTIKQWWIAAERILVDDERGMQVIREMAEVIAEYVDPAIEMRAWAHRRYVLAVRLLRWHVPERLAYWIARHVPEVLLSKSLD